MRAREFGEVVREKMLKASVLASKEATARRAGRLYGVLYDPENPRHAKWAGRLEAALEKRWNALQVGLLLVPPTCPFPSELVEQLLWKHVRPELSLIMAESVLIEISADRR